MVSTLARNGGQGLESAVIKGDLKDLSPEERVMYYAKVCESLNLNPLTKPFQYITLSGRLTLYATKDATEQLRSLRNVSVSITAREHVEGVYVVTARATLPDGRSDESIGAVSIEGLKGENLANAYMKAETKSKRRVTLSICGLGMLDETEVETIADARIEHLHDEYQIGEQSVLISPDELPFEDEDPDPPITKEDFQRLVELRDAAGVTAEQFTALIKEKYKVGRGSELRTSQWRALMDRFAASAS